MYNKLLFLTLYLFLISINLVFSQEKSTEDNTNNAKASIQKENPSPQVQTMNLEECIQYAVKNNTELEIQKLQIDLQKLNFNQTKNNVLPNLNSNITYGYNFGRTIDPTSNQFERTSASFTSLGSNLNLNLYNGLKLKRKKIQGALLVNASEYDYQYQKDELALKVSQAYLNVVLALELMKNNEIQVETDKKQLEKTKVLVEAGIQPKNVEISANSTYITSYSQLISTRNNLTLLYLRLKQLMKMDAEDPLEIEIPEDQPITKDIPLSNTIYKSAINVQKNIKSSTLKEKIALLEEGIAKSDYYPQLSLNATLRSNYSSISNTSRNIYEGVETKTVNVGVVQKTNDVVVTDVTTPKVVGNLPDYPLIDQISDNFSQSVNLNLSIPIFNKFQARNNLQKARVLKHQAELNTWLAKQNLRHRIEQSYQEAVSAYENYNAAQNNVKALQETFRADEERYQSAVLDIVSFEISKNKYFSAKNTLTQRKYEYLFRKILLQLYSEPYIYE